MKIRNLDYLRSLSTKDLPGFGAKLYETLSDLLQAHQNLSQQVNGNASGNPAPPPSIANLKVTGQNGHHNLAISDPNPIYRGVRYYAEFDTSPQFTNPRIVPMGDSRNANVFLGNGTYYWRAYSAYMSSNPSPPAYHGGAANPQPVNAGGSVGGPLLQDSQGSGTGTPRQGLSGPGPIPFRSATGAPPVRS
ncbi:MAG: hypothetical protein ACRD19_06040 [Terriglobia bacterium]